MKPRATIPLLLLLAVLVGLVVLGSLLTGARERLAPEPAALLPASSTRTSVELTGPAVDAPVSAPAIPDGAIEPAPVRTEEGDEAYDALLHVRVVRRSSEEPVRGVRVGALALPDEEAQEPSDWTSQTATLIARWRLFLRSGKRSHAVEGELAVTDPEGRARIRMPSGLGFRVFAAGDRDEMGARTMLCEEPLERGEERSVELVLSDEPVLLRGWVWDGARGIGGADVVVIDTTDHWEPRTKARLVAGPLGAFEVPLAPWRSWALELRAPGFATARYDLAYSAVYEQETYLLRRSAGLALEVVLGDGPLAGSASLALTDVQALADAYSTAWMGGDAGTWRCELDPRGRSRFEGLPPGEELTLRVRDAAGRLVHEETLELVPGETRERRLELDGVGTVSGRVVDAGGAPLAGWTVRLAPEPPSEGIPEQAPAAPSPLVTRSDAEGRFAFPSVELGAWRLALEAGPEQPSDVSERFCVGAEPVQLAIVVRTDCGWLEGRVVDPTGAPIADVPILVEGEGSAARRTSSDRAGAFVLEDLLAGDVRVGAGGTTTPAAIVAGEPTQLRLELGTIGRIEGRVALSPGTRADALDGAQLLVLDARGWWEPCESEEAPGFSVLPRRLDPPSLLVPIDEGRFAVGGLWLGHYDLVLVAEGLEGHLLSVPSLPPGESEPLVLRGVPKDPAAALSIQRIVERLEQARN